RSPGIYARAEPDLRRYLAEHLPEAFVPSLFVTLPALPLTPNGKVDRKALPAPDLSRREGSGYEAPRSEMERAIAGIWKDVLGVEKVGLNDNFFDLGGHSLLAAQVHARLRQALGRDDLTMVDLFRYPTVAALARHLRPDAAAPAVVLRERRAPGRKDVAIIAMAGRFPGAPSVGDFWRRLRNGEECIASFSDQELIEAGIGPGLLADPAYVKASGVIDGAETFDAPFFGFNPREAEVMDPQHRVFLECAWEALESAGYDPERYAGRIGVFAGVGINTYLHYAGADLLATSAGRYQAFIANDKDFVPTRVSYKLNLKGPSVNVQTACSTSLVALHLACQSLAAGDCDMALVGGVSIRSPQKEGYLFEEGGILSPDGHCRAFDADSRGTVFGNGVGLVVIKRLDDALADGDTVHAVVKGTAINNDGSGKVGYTAPSVEGQARVIADALAAAGVEPETVTYVEAHGTGTALGDPIEVAALSEVFGAHTRKHGFCALGSVKTNIGHLDTAAGVAGLIKTVQAMKHGELPPSLHYRAPNPKIDFAASPFYVNAALAEWPAGGGPRRAGVSSFGIGGTNAHVVLEEAPPAASEPTGPSRPWQVLALSARTPAALDAATRNLAKHLAEEPELPLADAAYTLSLGRKPFAHRRAVVCRDREDALAALADPERWITGQQEPGDRSAAFLFSGQGSQYPGMGRELYETEPVFRHELDVCAELLAPHLGLDLREVLYPDLFHSGLSQEEAERRLDQTALTQPVLFAIEYALARLWMSWGIQPAAMLGHSIGEYVAACLAGVFELADALALVAARGRLMQSLPAGAMLGVDLHEAEIAPYLGPGLSLAAVNGPSSCVVSGPEEAVAELEGRLAGLGVRVRRLHTSHAFHSAMMDPILDAFTAEVARVHRATPRLPWVSNLTGTWITPEDATDPGYWSRHLRGAVRFADGVRTLLADSDRVLLEVGPGHTLATLARQAGPGRTIVSSLRHPRDPQPDSALILRALGRLWLSGVVVDWTGFWSGERRRRVPLPTYPFERQRYWLEPKQRLAPAPADRLARKDDIADWFYAPVWRQTAPLPRFAAPESASRWLLLTGDRVGGPGEALMARLAERLREAGCQVALATSLPETWDAVPRRIVHALNLTAPGGTALDRLDSARLHAFDSLVSLAQALERSASGEAVRIGVLSNGLQRVTGERVTHPEKALLLGPVAVIPQEVPNLSLQSLDLALPAPGSLEEDDLLDDLLAEMAAPAVRPAESVVAFRGGERWVRGFGPARLEGRSEPFSRLREGGVYLITGGLGGLGLALAEELAGRVRAKLVLTGRRAVLPDETRRSLEAIGAEVETFAADVTDPEAMAAAVLFAEERFGALHGVVHAAGVPGGGIVHLKTPEAAWRVMAPKVQGTLALDAALAGRDLDFVVLCSSINAAIGGFGQSDYAAANAFLDAWAQAGWRGARRGRFTAAIAWDRWEEVGMAARSSSPLALWGGGTAPEHPLLDACLVETPEREVYRTTLSPEKHWVLSEHWIAGRPTVPGTTYLEMARAAFAKRAQGRGVELREVVFLAPLALDAGQTREVLTLLEKDGDGFTFRVVSKTGVEAGEALWLEHARGRIDTREAAEPVRRDVAGLLGTPKDTREVTVEDVIGARRAGFLVTGPRWQSLKSLRVGDGESLAVLELDEDFAADLGRYELHPALLDVAAGAVQFLAEGNFLPLTYESLRLHAPLTRRGYSHFRLRGSGGETITCDITLLDEDGRELAEIEGFSMRRVSDSAAVQLRAPADDVKGNLRLPGFDDSGVTEKRLGEGISPHQGREAFLRVLREGGVPHVVVSTRDLEAVIEDVAALTRSRLAEELGKLTAPSAPHARPEVSSAYTAPTDDFERQVAEVWERVLGIERVGVHDNFFELGGTSLTGIQLVTELKKRLHVDLPTVSIFEAPTVAALARYLKPASGPGGTVSVFQQTRSRAEKKKQALQNAAARKRRR
ncbi:MAG TPA: SDR family NAD(P)-dependent oxidoreductase, partial [Thermoanaerobaculia bacterium]|nr:SDR family NAD(P)-dependent oxidoreductase [Thermoanaerobaculia bacterium]